MKKIVAIGEYSRRLKFTDIVVAMLGTAGLALSMIELEDNYE